MTTSSPILFAGIDPGIAGAVGLVDHAGRFAGVEDMPVLPTTTGRKQIDPPRLAAILRQHRPAFVLVERVGPRPGEGAVGGFGFGHSFGCILGVLGALELPHGSDSARSLEAPRRHPRRQRQGRIGRHRETRPPPCRRTP